MHTTHTARVHQTPCTGRTWRACPAVRAAVVADEAQADSLGAHPYPPDPHTQVSKSSFLEPAKPCSSDPSSQGKNQSVSLLSLDGKKAPERTPT